MTQAWDFVNATILWQRESVTILDGPDQDIDDVEWEGGVGTGARIRNYLRANKWNPDGPRTLRDLSRMTTAEVMRAPNIGRLAVKEINRVLAQHNLHLGME
jgi:DNA-directed RNA polymerase alpha subunit